MGVSGMSQQLGSEVERQGKQVNYTQDSSFFSKKEEELPWVGFEPTALYSRHIEGLRNFDDVIVSDGDGETDAGLVGQNQSDGRKHGSREETIVNSTCTQSITGFVRTTKTIFNVLEIFYLHKLSIFVHKYDHH